MLEQDTEMAKRYVFRSVVKSIAKSSKGFDIDSS